MRNWGDLDEPTLRPSRTNAKHFRSVIAEGEEVLAVANAVNRGYWVGLLAVTTSRIVFVCQRVILRPRVISLDFAKIASARMDIQPLTGSLVLETDEGPVRFRLISPKERTWPLYWRVGERIGQIPLRGHS